jgi:mannose-6-phosphate isomerase-like protein (cupin superfamily)
MSVFVAVLLVSALLAAGADAGPDAGEMLEAFARTCTELAAPAGEVVVQFDITQPDERWHVTIDGNGTVSVIAGEHDAPAMTLVMSGETMARIFEGEITAFTAAGKGSGADVAPLEIEFGTAAGQFEDPKETMLGFLQHFFARQRPERIELGEEHSRVVHGAHGIPLYYAEGFRSAWYLLKAGQRLNEPGDTNPYPQAFVIISGRGGAKIGEAEIEVSGGESYYIPPDSDHVLWAAPGETLTVIWMAWGEGA